MVSPIPKFTFDTTGIVAPHGNAVRKPATADPVTVRFNATALAPAGAGTVSTCAGPVCVCRAAGRGVTGVNREGRRRTHPGCRPPDRRTADVNTHRVRALGTGSTASAPRLVPAV